MCGPELARKNPVNQRDLGAASGSREAPSERHEFLETTKRNGIGLRDCGGENEATNATGEIQGQERGDHASEGQAEDVGELDAQVVE